MRVLLSTVIRLACAAGLAAADSPKIALVPAAEGTPGAVEVTGFPRERLVKLREAMERDRERKR